MKRLGGVVVCAVALWAVPAVAQEIAGAREMSDGAMRPDIEVSTFAHSDKLFPVRVVQRGEKVSELLDAKRALKNVRFEQTQDPASNYPP